MPSKQDFRNWIEAGESSFGKVKGEYDKAREYFENEQTPSNVPSDKDYIQYNLITASVRRAIGEMVSSRITPVLIGGGDLTEVLRELFNDILMENRFQENIMPAALNYFYTEGFAGIKFFDNVNKRSKYGIGSPEIHFLRPEDCWLDDNSRDLFHNDDIYRIHPKRITLDAALRNPAWAAHRKEIVQSTREQETVSPSGIKWVDVYEVEYRETEYGKQNGASVEGDVYYITKFINKIVQVEAPKKTGYPTFRIIPMIHTPRTSVGSGKYPYGLYTLLGQAQDLLNITYSVILESVKASIKQIVVASGATPEEQKIHRAEMTKTNAYLSTKSPSSRIQVINGVPINPALTEFADRIRFMVDEMSAQFAPDRGQVSGDLSGRAINSLQAAGKVPELVAQTHIENTLTQLSVCILHYIRTRMIRPFSINREINGDQRDIAFNAAAPTGFQGDQFSILQGGYINDLRNIPENLRMKIEVDLNPAAKRDFNINVALLLRERGDLSLQDELKALYPFSWQDKLRNITRENQAAALIQDMANTSPEAVQQFAQLWEQVKPQLEQQQRQQDQLQRQQVKTNGQV